jgi:HAD superfamily hydrolase (TIGR01509 family)
MTQFDLIIFDCDGVVVDSEILSCGCLLTLLHQHEIAVDLPEIYQRFLGRSFQAVEEQFAVWRGRRIPEDFRDRLEAAIRVSFSASLHAMPGILDLLRALPTRFCLASSSGIERIRLSLALTGLTELFAGRVFNAEMVQHGKPAPDLFLHAAAAMDVAPSRALVIEDSVSGVAAGVAAGMTVWGFTGGSHYAGRDGAKLLGASGAVRTFDKMADLQRQLAG